MANTKHHFDWKKLEDKPDNWETLRQLISLCNSPNNVYSQETLPDNNWTQIFYEIFKEKILRDYGKDTERCFPTSRPSSPTTTTTSKKKTQNKKKKVSIKEQIHQETEKKMIEKDLGLIRFDPKSIVPIFTSFRLQPTFSFMVAEWVIILWKKTFLLKQKVDKGVLTNAMISLDRIVCEEVLTKEKIYEPIFLFFRHLNKLIQPMLSKTDLFEQLFSYHPELMVNPFSQKREGRIGLYQEQIKVLQHVVDAVMLDQPMLLGDRMPPGTGKTFLAVPLAQKLAAIHSKKTLLFACHNQLVRTDVASLALLGKNIHLWMGVYDAVEDEFLIRPHKSCFPVTWKKVYKTHDDNKTGSVFQQFMFYKQATSHVPNLLVVDLPTCKALLQDPRLQNQFVAYIDEFVSEPTANQIMVDISQYLPKQTILLSAILPRFEDIPAVIAHFQNRHKDAEIVRIESNQLTISCTVVDPQGRVSLPHHFIESVDQIPLLIQRIREDPLIGRMYAPQQVYALVNHLQSDLRRSGLTFEERFPSLSKIDHAGVRSYVLDLLEYVQMHPLIFDKMRSFRPCLMPSPSLETICTKDSNHFMGKTLVITSSDVLYPTLHTMKKSLHANAPILSDLLSLLEKKKEVLKKELDQLMSESGSKSKQKIDPIEQQQNISRVRDELQSCFNSPWPDQFVVNTADHAKRFGHHMSKHMVRPNLPSEYESAFPEFLLSLLLSGIGVYDFSQCTEHQRRLTMRVVKQLSFLFAGKEIVFGTNIEGLTHLFIDKSFGDHASRNVLYQLIGRAGRMGQSYQALIALNGESTLKTIMNFVDTKDEDAEFFQQYFLNL